MKTFVRLITRCFAWGALVALAFLVVGVHWFYTHVHEEVRKAGRAKLQTMFPHLQVDVQSARLVEGEGYELRGVRLRDPDEPERPLAEVDEVFVGAGTDLADLVQKKIEIRHLVVRRPRVNVFRCRDGAWSVLRLQPRTPSPTAKPPRVLIEGGACAVYLRVGDEAPSWTLQDLRLDVRLATPAWPLASSEGPLKLQAAGSARGDYLRSVSFEAVQNEAGDWTGKGDVAGLEIGPEVRSALASFLPEGTAAPDFRGVLRVGGTVAYRPAAEAKWDFRVEAALERGSVSDPRLDHPFRDVEAKAVFTPGGVLLESLSLRHEQGEVALQGQTWGYHLKSPLQLRGEVKSFSLSDDWAALLPEKLRRWWIDYSPTGRVDARLAVTFDGREWFPDVVVDCHEVTFCYVKFPYRLTRGRGQIRWSQRRLTGALVCFGGGQPLDIEFAFQNPGPETQGKATIRGTNLETDRALWLSLPPRPSQIVQSLHPAGKFNLQVDMERAAGRGQPLDVHVTAKFSEGEIRYDGFSYPISGIQGSMEGWGVVASPEAVEPHPPIWKWAFRDLVGRNGGGVVRATAEVLPPDSEHFFRLDLFAERVALDEELLAALPPRMTASWRALRPSGRIDVEAKVLCRAGRKPELRAVVRPRDASVEPLHFPYRLEKVTGVFTYEKDAVVMEEVRAVHGAVNVRGGGKCSWDELGAWRVHFEQFGVERLHFDRGVHDRELFPAMPAGLRRAIEPLEPAGLVAIDGEWEIGGDSQKPGVIQGAWDLQIGCQRLSLRKPLPIHQVFGAIRIRGAYDGATVFAQGEVDCDSVDQETLQFTQVRGPFWLDDTQILFGTLEGLRPRAANAPLPEGERHVTAKLAGGTVIGDAHVILSEQPRYHIRAALVDASLQRYAQEFIAGPQSNLSGRLWASIDLTGAGEGRHSWQGTGQVNLRDANIYELPVILALLRIASLREPKDSVFTEADVQFRIEGPYFYFDRLNFRGEAMSLRGTGSMNLNQEIALEFYTIVGQDRVRIPVVDEVIGRTAQQLLLVRVDGTLQEPRTRREILPVVSEALQQLFQELTGTPAGAARQAGGSIGSGLFRK